MLHHADDSSFEREVLQHSGSVLVDFYTPTCQPCRQLAPELEKLSHHFQSVKIVKVDATQAPQVASYYQIVSVPVLIGFRNGEPVQRVNGKPPLHRLRAMLQSLS